MMLEKYGEDQLERSCEKFRSITWSKTEERNVLHTVKKKRIANLMGVILCRNCLLKHLIIGKRDRRIEVTEDEEEEVSSYKIALRKREGTGN